MKHFFSFPYLYSTIMEENRKNCNFVGNINSGNRIFVFILTVSFKKLLLLYDGGHIVGKGAW